MDAVWGADSLLQKIQRMAIGALLLSFRVSWSESVPRERILGPREIWAGKGGLASTLERVVVSSSAGLIPPKTYELSITVPRTGYSILPSPRRESTTHTLCLVNCAGRLSPICLSARNFSRNLGCF